MRRFRSTVHCALAALLLAASPHAAHAQRRVRADAGRPLIAESLADTALASLVRAEGTFMRETDTRRVDGWVDAFVDDAASFAPRAPIGVGTAPIRAGMGRALGDSSVHVVWHPVYAEVARSGDLGYTYGYARWSSRDSTGKALPTSDSKYVTIWRRDAAGRWKVVADLGNEAKVPDGFFDATHP
ncbi:MAG: hypothetical protein JO180_02775 [Gemmatirosa sp.]|nr:hypothetical protein [Gemmatirosa sp.]